MRSLLLTTLAISTTALSFVACSGGGGGGASSSDGIGASTSAQFIDAPVKGLTFEGSAGSSGKTAAQGLFTCKRGEVVNFSLKGFKLGQAACGEKIFVQDLFAPVDVLTGYTWQRAASVIQSFATGSSELDLTAANASVSLDLSSVDYTGNDSAFNSDVTAALSSSAIPNITQKDINTATGHANTSMADNAQLNEAYAAALAEFVQAPTNGNLLLKASLTSPQITVDGADLCNRKIDVKMKVSVDNSTGKDVYSLATIRAIGYDVAGEAAADAVCASSPNTGKCEAITGAMLPKSKVITGLKFDVAAAAVIPDHFSVTGFNVASNTVVALAASVGADSVKVGGTFYNELSVLAVPSNVPGFPVSVGQKFKCVYSID